MYAPVGNTGASPAADRTPGTLTRYTRSFISGTVVYVEKADGCWRLDDGEGRHYELLPDQAPAELLQDGLHATVSGQTADDSNTGCQVGLPIAVRRIVSMEPAPTTH